MRTWLNRCKWTSGGAAAAFVMMAVAAAKKSLNLQKVEPVELRTKKNSIMEVNIMWGCGWNRCNWGCGGRWWGRRGCGCGWC